MITDSGAGRYTERALQATVFSGSALEIVWILESVIVAVMLYVLSHKDRGP